MRIGAVAPFDMGGMKEKALKPIEEAAEVFGAYQDYVDACDNDETHAGYAASAMLDEIADCIQACANLAAMVGCSDLTPYMERCRYRNEERGRYDA